MIIRPTFNIKCEDCIYGDKQPGGLILCSVPEGRCYKFHEADKIREMANEELAEFIGENNCPPSMGLQSCPKGSCADCWKQWLNAEAKE